MTIEAGLPGTSRERRLHSPCGNGPEPFKLSGTFVKDHWPTRSNQGEAPSPTVKRRGPSSAKANGEPRSNATDKAATANSFLGEVFTMDTGVDSRMGGEVCPPLLMRTAVAAIPRCV